jgi:hypothetical protein
LRSKIGHPSKVGISYLATTIQNRQLLEVGNKLGGHYNPK